MSLILKSYTGKNKKVEWNWPLRIAVHTYDQELFTALDEMRQYGQFTLMHPIAKINDRQKRERLGSNRAKGKYDIALIIDDGKSNLASFKSIRATYVIVCQVRSADRRYETYGVKYKTLITALLDSFSASGILFFPLGNQPWLVTAWFKKFMKALATNSTILKAIKTSVKEGYLLYEASSVSDTPLERGFVTTAERFKKIYDQTYSTLPASRKYQGVRQQFNILKSSFDSAGKFDSANKMQMANVNLELFKKVADLHEQAKAHQVIVRTVETKLAKFKRVEIDPEIIEVSIEQEPRWGNVAAEEMASPELVEAHEVITSVVDERIMEPLTADQLERQNARYLQAGITAKRKPGVILKQYLEPGKRYVLSVSIGRLNEELLQAPDIFPEDDIFIETRTAEEPITVVFQPVGEGDIQSQTLLLPKLQDSQAVDFEFTTAEDEKTFNADVLASHKGRMIQILHLSAPVQTAALEPGQSGIKLKTVFSARKELGGLGDRQAFDLALHYEVQDGQPMITGVVEKKPIRFNTDGGLPGIINNIKTTIEAAARQPEDYPLDIYHPNNQLLLLKLAIFGAQLNTNMIKGQVTGDGPLQVIANRAVFAPFDFVYSLPAPKLDAQLCLHAKEALRQGSCMGCFDRNQGTPPWICPFGFWGFNRVIERFKYDSDISANSTSDLVIYSEPATGRDTLTILQKTIHGSSQRVDNSEPDLRQKIAAFLSSKSNTAAVETWKDWEIQTDAHQPETIVLITHVQRNPQFSLDEMEIGSDMLPQVHLSEKHLLKKMKPFAIVIGCEIDNIANQGFDISSEFLNKGAAIVITNFTKIMGDQAGLIVMRLVDLLKANTGRKIQLGEVILKLKQQLLAEGVMAVLSLTAYGDADWKIIT